MRGAEDDGNDMVDDGEDNNRAEADVDGGEDENHHDPQPFSPIDVTNHGRLFRTIPYYVRPLWVATCRLFFHRYLTQNDTPTDRLDCLLDLLLLPAEALGQRRGERSLHAAKKTSKRDARAHKGRRSTLAKQITTAAQAIRDKQAAKKSDEDSATPCAPLGSFNHARPGQAPKPRTSARMQRVMQHVRNGHLSRAIKCLTQQEADPVDDDTLIRDMYNLHPKGPDANALPGLPADAPRTVITTKQVASTVRRLATGASPGPSGWTADLLLPLLEDDVCLRGLTRLINDIVNGNFDQRGQDFLTASWLIGIPKPGRKGVRPIAMGEVFYKIAATITVANCKLAIGEYLAPVQLGVGTPDGNTIAYLMIQSLLAPEGGPAESGFAIDMTNAFNCVDRKHMLESFFQRPELRPAWRLIHFSYSKHARLFLRGSAGALSAQIMSSQGVRQGDPLGSLAFAVALQPILLGTLSKFPIKIVAVHDDTTFAGSPESVVDAALHFQAEARKINLDFGIGKCRLLAFHNEQITATLQQKLCSFDHYGIIQIERNCHTLLGVPLGTGGVKEAIDGIITDMSKDFNCIMTADLPKQVRFALLRLCSQTKPTYLARALPAALVQSALQRFDKCVFTAASQVVDVPALADLDPCRPPHKGEVNNSTTKLLCQANLPLKRAGLGLRLHNSIMPAAYIGSIATAARYLTQCRTDQQKAHSIAAPVVLNGIVNSIRALQELQGNHFRQLEGTALPPQEQLRDSEACLSFYAQQDKPLRKVQRLINSKTNDAAQSWLESVLPGRDRARLLSASGRAAGCALNAIPVVPSLAIPDNAFDTLVQMRLGVVPPVPRGVPSRCPCGAEDADLANFPEHPLSCKLLKRRELNHRHNEIVQVIAGIARLAGCDAQVEPASVLFEDGRHPDLQLIAGLEHHMIDVTISHPLCPSHLVLAGTQGAVAARREKDKHTKYGQQCKAFGYDFHAVSMESLGLMGEGCKQLFRIINNHANNTPSLGFADDYIHGLLTHGCAAALARGNHKALEAGRAHALQWSRQGCSGHYAAGRLKSHLGAEDGSD